MTHKAPRIIQISNVLQWVFCTATNVISLGHPTPKVQQYRRYWILYLSYASGKPAFGYLRSSELQSNVRHRASIKQKVHMPTGTRYKWARYNWTKGHATGIYNTARRWNQKYKMLRPKWHALVAHTTWLQQDFLLYSRLGLHQLRVQNPQKLWVLLNNWTTAMSPFCINSWNTRLPLYVQSERVLGLRCFDWRGDKKSQQTICRDTLTPYGPFSTFSWTPGKTQHARYQEAGDPCDTHA